MSADATATPNLPGAEAWRAMSAANLALFLEYPLRVMGGRWRHWDEAWAADAASPAAYPNSATLLQPLAEEGADDLVTRLAQFYGQETGGPWMLWSAWPTPDLTGYDMQSAGYATLMVRLPAPLSLAATGLRISEARDESDLRDFDEAVIHGYPVPELTFPDDRITDGRVLGGPMHYFVGYQDNRPVTCAAAYVAEREVGVYMVATLPEARGKGFGAAITAATIAAAPHLPAVLQASEPGQPVYSKLGFQVISPYTIWYKPR